MTKLTNHQSEIFKKLMDKVRECAVELPPTTTKNKTIKQGNKMKGNLNKLIDQGPITILRFYQNHKEAWRLHKHLKCPYEIVIQEGELSHLALGAFGGEDGGTPWDVLEEMGQLYTPDVELRVLYLTEPQYIMYKLMENHDAYEYVEEIKIGTLTKEMIDNYEYLGEWE